MVLFNTGGLEVQGGHDQSKSLKDCSGCCSGNNVGNKRGSKDDSYRRDAGGLGSWGSDSREGDKHCLYPA